MAAKPSGQEPAISKTKFLSGLQCHKLLWRVFNAKDLIPETDAATQAIFDQGHVVGALAKQMFLDGVEIAGIHDSDEMTRLTQKALKLSKRLFEAAFAANSGFCRVDALQPAPGDAWDIIEVKSTTSLKDVHLEDGSKFLASTGIGGLVCQTLLRPWNRRLMREGLGPVA